jgi:GNAT superfamily N-acetyltransferase
MDASVIIRPAATSECDILYAIDDDACTLFGQVGLDDDLPPDHPFTRAEHARWAAASAQGNAFFAQWPGGGPVGMLVMDLVGGAPYVEQLSVRRTSMGKGLGRRLLMYAVAWAAGRPLWLTTYSHVPWNRPFYETAGFGVVPESGCPRSIVEILDDQRRWLPAPGERIAMRRTPR